nr:beta-ketoacyl synthase [uncultured bacterium]
MELKGADLYEVTCAAALAQLVDSLVNATPEPPSPPPPPPAPRPRSEPRAEEKPRRTEAAVRNVPAVPREAPRTASVAATATALRQDSVPAAPDGVSVVCGLVSELTGRVVREDVSFSDAGLTSFDMLRVIARLEAEAGPLPKSLLFEQETPRALAGWLQERFGPQMVGGLKSKKSPVAQLTGADRPTELLANGAAVVAKKRLPEHPELAALAAQLESRFAKEGGLPGRDIAPLLFLGSNGKGYLNFTERDGVLLAWSCAVSEQDFPVLVGEWTEWARENNLHPNLLSMLPLTEVAGVPFCSTPFGTVQRLHGIDKFSLEGGSMKRLRQRLHKFERSGTVEVKEYRLGTDSAVDMAIATLIDQWAARKAMVNPYVETVRKEVAQGIMADRHRVFLTYVDGEMLAAVVVTKIPSENGYLLDLEFFGDKMEDGGLDYTIIEIIKRLAAEGCELFSFGATLGVVVGTSSNPHPQVEQVLGDLRAAGLFRGDGNFQFKNKYRPENLPVYLCQPASASAADVLAVILLIANPTLGKQPQGQTESQPEASAPEHSKVLPLRVEETPAVVPPSTKPAPRPVPEAVPSDSPRQAELRSVGWNPLALPRMAGPFELVTDSWAERDEAAVADRSRELADRASAITRELSEQNTLPFEYVQAAPSGRAAEAALLRAIGSKRTIIQTNLFPSWTFNALDLGFRPVTVRTKAGSADVDLEHLGELLAAHRESAGLCCIELSPNATGGLPISLENARGISELTRKAGVPLVFDATRGLDNAWLLARAQGQQLWTVARELFSCADAITLSLPKTYGVAAGGLVATSHPALIRALRRRIADRGEEVGLAERRLLASALADREWIEEAVRTRVRHTEQLAERLRACGAPIRAAGGHAILLDAARLCGKGFTHPVPATLAWLYETAGVRAAPHLSAGFAPTEGCLRLAVPIGLSDGEVEQLAEALEGAFKGTERPADLLRVPDDGEGPAFYERRDHVPEDVAEDIEKGNAVKTAGENWAVVSQWQPQAVRRLIPHEGGQIEVFEAGQGAPVVFLHPFNIGLGFFAPQLRDLATTNRVIGVHAPGVGATTAAGDLSFAGLARTVLAAVRGLGVTERFVVAGASFGGLTALSVAHLYPEDVSGLVLLGSSHRVGNRRGDVNRLVVVAREDFDAVTNAGARLGTSREELEALLLRCESIDPRIGLRYLDQFASRPDLLEQAAKLKVPALIVHGVHDTVIKLEVAKLVHRTISGSRYVEIPTAGHFPSLTSPDEVNALISTFAKDVQAS